METIGIDTGAVRIHLCAMDPESILRIAAELKNLSRIRSFVQKTAAALGADRDVIADIILATDEAVTNVIVHGYQDGPGMIEIELRRNGNAIVVYVRDQSVPFDPTSIPAPDVNQPLEERPLGGMGIHIIRQLMDEVRHHITPQGGNELIMIKRGIA
jgi:serine/threonine-protein kinase RsbW